MYFFCHIPNYLRKLKTRYASLCSFIYYKWLFVSSNVSVSRIHQLCIVPRRSVSIIKHRFLLNRISLKGFPSNAHQLFRPLTLSLCKTTFRFRCTTSGLRFRMGVDKIMHCSNHVSDLWSERLKRLHVCWLCELFVGEIYIH